MDFLPKDYEIPSKPGKYFKFNQGENVFRILGSAITGWEAWTSEQVEDENGKMVEKRSPIRKHEGDAFDMDEIEDPEATKHFMIFPVWSPKDKRIQVLEITQSMIKRPITSLSKNKAWGDVTGYDIVVTKIGEKKETRYTVNPLPPEPMSDEISTAWGAVQAEGFDLERMYVNGDPFGTKE